MRRWHQIDALTAPAISDWPARSQKAPHGFRSYPQIEQTDSAPRPDPLFGPASSIAPVPVSRTNAAYAPTHAYREAPPGAVPGSCWPRLVGRKNLAHVFRQLRPSDVVATGKRSLARYRFVRRILG